MECQSKVDFKGTHFTLGHFCPQPELAPKGVTVPGQQSFPQARGFLFSGAGVPLRVGFMLFRFYQFSNVSPKRLAFSFFFHICIRFQERSHLSVLSPASGRAQSVLSGLQFQALGSLLVQPDHAHSAPLAPSSSLRCPGSGLARSSLKQLLRAQSMVACPCAPDCPEQEQVLLLVVPKPGQHWHSVGITKIHGKEAGRNLSSRLGCLLRELG